MKKALAIDVGGTKIYHTIVSDSGEILEEVQHNKTPKSFEGVRDLLESIIRIHENQVDVVGLATAGAVSNDNTRVISSTGNLVANYNELDFQSLSKKPVFVENDANCAAWAEHALGASKGCGVSIMLTLGTGVGGGIIIDNKILKGKSGAAGEMHFKMFSDKRRKCTCGAWDCFEIYASGTALQLTAREITENENITSYDVIAGVKSGDKLMMMIFDTWQNYILTGLIGLANLFDPDCIVLSGSMAEFVDVEYLQSEANKEIVTTPFRVIKATSGNYAGMIGASLLAFDKFKD